MVSGKVAAILISDIHLSHTVPVARSAESDWYLAQGRVLGQIKQLKDRYGCPVICSGDIFDKWNVGVETINWAIRNLPAMYAIPGQHDLPWHRYEDIHRSAYWTLVEAGVVKDLGCEGEVLDRGGILSLHPFPWGFEIKPLQRVKDDRLHVAVVHSYVWAQGFGYSEAPMSSYWDSYSSRLGGYDVAVFGDNHHHFVKGRLWNCGCLIRRKLDERELKPVAGLLLESGRVEPYWLDVSEDKWMVENKGEVAESKTPELDAFLKELDSVEADFLDFVQELKRYLGTSTVDKGTRRILFEIVDSKE